MSTKYGVLFTLVLVVRGRKTKGQISRECTIPMKEAARWKINPGDSLTVEVVEHHPAPKVEEQIEGS